MLAPTPTLSQSWTYRKREAAGPALPGLLLLYSGAKAMYAPIPLGPGTNVLGRDGLGNALVEDARMSRRHAEVAFEGGRWRVRDLKSRNGTFLDGEPVAGEARVDDKRVLRIGDTLFGLLSDVRPFQGSVVELRDELVLGPTLRKAWKSIEDAAAGRVLHLTAESGCGKELAARHFHQASRRADGPFVAVNCATIPPNLAERLLFGAKKGAYSGADANADGYLQAAHGGTLFLDEIGELELTVQGKLLRVVESHEVLPLGAARPQPVDIAICSATHRDLRARAAEGAFRQDLLFRLGTPSVQLPPLRDRLEEIPWLIQLHAQRLGELTAHVSLVEACMTRHWPGNVRELLAEVGGALQRARAAGGARVEAAHLSPTAGVPLEPVEARAPAGDEQILEALRSEGGNVSRAARALGLHRTQLRRWIARHPDQAKDVVDKEPADD